MKKTMSKKQHNHIENKRDITITYDNNNNDENDDDDECQQIEDVHDYAIFEIITDDISRGVRFDFELLMIMKNGYSNLTELCKRYKADLKKLLATKSIIAYQTDISRYQEIPIDKLIIKISTPVKRVTNVNGLYGHPYLAEQIAMLISPAIGVQTSCLIKQYYIEKAVNKALDEQHEVHYQYSQKIQALISEIIKHCDNRDKIIAFNWDEAQKLITSMKYANEDDSD